MMATITLEKALEMRERGALLVDARSPSEYLEATIPGALNVPILDDEERAEVGTLYKDEGKQIARRRGVEIVAPKIPDLVDRVAAHADNNHPVVVFCWRGGMRSRALAQFLDLAGIPAVQLEGGHKRFRRHVLEFFETPLWGRLLVLRGLTGVGKTHLLKRLADDGFPVIDLEALANHRGSAFGNLGLSEQPTQKMFEARLWDSLHRIPEGAYALAEGESRHIGRVALPVNLHRALQLETSIWIEASLKTRVANILEDYPAIDQLKGDFIKPLQALKERLGKQTIDAYLELLESGRWDELVRELMVNYYDPLYRHTLPERRIEIDIDAAEGFEELKRAIGRLLEQ